MELRYLATFQAIVREGSFIRAAEMLSYAPSTITLHMQHLETELGFKLFVRQGKQIQLSTAGQPSMSRQMVCSSTRARWSRP